MAAARWWSFFARTSCRPTCIRRWRTFPKPCRARRAVRTNIFYLYLWDNRPESPTYLCHEVAIVGGDRPMTVLVPPGVVHAYRNVSAVAGLVINGPNRLYRGEGRVDPVDEIRHEDDPKSVFQLIDAI